MSNFTVNQLNKIVQSGDIEQLYSSGASRISSEGNVTREMEAQGMAPSSPQESGRTFSDLLRDSVEKVNVQQTQADTAIKELIAGRNKNIHETLLAVERADSSLKMMMQVRNKILDAYREIMRMQV